MPFPLGDITRMQAAQELHMHDTCHRLAYSKTVDDYNSPVETWTENATDIPCGIDQQAGSENLGAGNVTVTYDAVVRLPISQADVWDVKDRLLLTKRFGVAVTNIAYWVASPIQRGPSGLRMLLRKVDL